MLASAALAQPAGLPEFDLERLELNASGRGSLVMGTGELLPTGGFRLSLAGQHERAPLVVYRGGTRVGAVVEDRVMGHLLAAWAPLPGLELGMHLPVVAWQNGDDVRSAGIWAPARTGLSTPSLSARVGLLSQQRQAPVDLALELGAGLPLGSADTLSRERTVRLSPRVMVGRHFGWLRAGAEAGVVVRPSVIVIDDAHIQDEVGSEVRLGAVLATSGEGLRGELNVRGALPLSRQPGSMELLAGLRLPLGRSGEVYALGGPGFGRAPGTPTFRLLLGAAFGGGGRSAPVAVAVAVAAPRDGDADGVADATDACPTEAGPAERQGCPVKDGDGLASDGDAMDQGGPAEQKQLVSIEKGKLEIQETVFFATGKMEIEPRSFALLEQVAQVLREHPQLDKVIIEGHTDNHGNAETNRELSRVRAETVKDYLVKQGVKASRLEAKGYGPDHPIATNETEEGRAANRRVEFTIVTPDEH
jgi:outer membrane protein OmpA-like peptidoglycan-associated protein